MSKGEKLKSLVENFVGQVEALIRQEASEDIQSKLADFLSGDGKTTSAKNGKRRGRPPGSKNKAARKRGAKAGTETAEAASTETSNGVTEAPAEVPDAVVVEEAAST